MIVGERLESAFCQHFVFIPFDINFVSVTLTIQIEVQFQRNFRKVNGSLIVDYVSWDQTSPRNDYSVVLTTLKGLKRAILFHPLSFYMGLLTLI